MKKIAVLASGRGSNFQAVIDRISDGYIPARCCVLITDNPDAYVIERANDAGIPVEVVDYHSFEDKERYEEKVMEMLSIYQTDLVLLAGYMRILGKNIVDCYKGRMINIHPSLLPSFPGLNAQQQAVDYGVKIAGCTVHFVTPEMDAGPVIIQRSVSVLENDDGDSLASRILDEEHIALPEAVKLYCEGKLEVKNRQVCIRY